MIDGTTCKYPVILNTSKSYFWRNQAWSTTILICAQQGQNFTDASCVMDSAAW